MDSQQRLLARLDAIGMSLEQSGSALALIGLGSVGLERERVDEYSDLDFFVIVKEDYKQQFLSDLSWLSNVHSIAYAFQNTSDGYKLLYADGIFCEFAVFERAELATIPFNAGRIVWKDPAVDEQIAAPQLRNAGTARATPVEWAIGEALTNLYVGLGRDLRGEKLSAARLIQQHAVDRILELAELVEPAQPARSDPFARERRFEQRFPNIARALPTFVQGYNYNRESARAILAFLEQHFDVNAAMARAIRALYER